jgi:thymidylate synthase (FAD)
MTDSLEILDDVEVKLIDAMASDLSVTRSAQVSVKGENKPETDTPRLINYLMSARHGSPFEHATFTWFVKAPIFVFREFHRHRIASYNEMSGRYTQLLPEFYIPGPERPLVNKGGSARPEFIPGTESQYDLMVDHVSEVYEIAWENYEILLASGIANEVARIVLPVGIMSQMYVTMNARALMNFLSLRIDHPEAAVRSRPQREIQMVAEKMEEDFKAQMPHTWEAWHSNGRVAP